VGTNCFYRHFFPTVAGFHRAALLIVGTLFETMVFFEHQF